MKKKLFLYVILVFTFLFSTCGYLLTSNSLADVTTNNNISIDGIGAEDALDENGKIINASEWSSGLDYKVSYNYFITDGVVINKGDSSTLTLPSGSVFKNNENFNLMDNDGNIIGHFFANFGDSSATITWSDYFAKYPDNRHGTISIIATGLIPQPSNVLYINKNGWVINQDPNGRYLQSQWELRLNPKKNNISNLRVSDTVSNTDTQAIDKDSFIIKYTNTGVDVPKNKYALDTNENGFELVFNTDVEDDIKVLYTTTFISGIPYLIDGTTMIFTNSASMTGKDNTNNRTISDSTSKDLMVGDEGKGQAFNKSVILTKKDSTNGKAIPNTHFKLLDSNMNEVTTYTNLITNTNGQIHIKNLDSGTYYLIETKAADNYLIDSTPQKFYISDNQKFSDIIMFNNTPIPFIGGSLTVNYQDTTGNQIHDPVVKSGNIGDSYTTDQLTIPGYTFKEVQGNPSGTFTDQEQTVTYIYTKDPIAGGKVTAKYLDTTGTQIHDPVVKSGNIGQPYGTKPLIIDGYYLIDIKGDPIGFFTDQEQTVTYIYKKIELPPIPTLTPGKGTSTPAQTNSSIPSAGNNTLPQSNTPTTDTGTPKQYPATGEKQNHSWLIAGILLILAILGYYFWDRNKKKTD